MPNFQVTNFQGPSSMRFSTGAYCSSIIENTGEESGTQDIIFKIDPDTEDTIRSSLSLSEGETQFVGTTFSVPDSTGSYDYSIESDDDKAETTLSVVDDLSDSEVEQIIISLSSVTPFKITQKIEIAKLEHFSIIEVEDIEVGDIEDLLRDILDDEDEEAVQEIIDILLEDGPFKVSNFVFADNKDPLMLLDENYVPPDDNNGDDTNE